MWLVLMFDLPVMTKPQRKAATGFRQWLLDEGWEMSQFSVYLRWCAAKEQAETRVRAVARKVPAEGKVHVLTVTDRQFERMAVFRGRSRERGGRRQSDQLMLF
jgi:CRISPR-associated protein Cas2